MSSITTSQLPELFFNLVTRPFETATPTTQPAPANTVTCSKCGAPLAAPASGSKFCPKCGDAVGPGEKFCDKCGTPLK